jgi:valyl-tRNA synthetase
LGLALEVLLRLFAPFQPFAAEEVWSWFHPEDQSVHLAPWPTLAELPGGGDGDVLATAGVVLGLLRKVKSEAKVSQRTELAVARLSMPTELTGAAMAGFEDIRAAGRVTQLTFEASTAQAPELLEAGLAPPA